MMYYIVRLLMHKTKLFSENEQPHDVRFWHSQSLRKPTIKRLTRHR